MVIGTLRATRLNKFILSSLLLVTAGLQAASAQDGEPLRFEDPVLEQVIRGQLIDGGPVQLHAADVSDIDQLFLEWPATDEQVHSLEGIQALVNLNYLNLRGNSVSDISPLAGLEYLETVDLQENQVVQIPGMDGFRWLSDLNLAGNQVRDISGLASMTNMRHLNLSANQVSDVSSLAGLEYLSDALLHGNALSDISALADLANQPDFYGLTLFDNPELDLCTGSPARAVTDELLDVGIEVLYQEYATGGAACPEIADLEPLRITKTVAGHEESILVQGGKLARLNPDGTRIVATCQGTARVISLINEGEGLYWSGLFEEFTRQLSQFIPVQLLPDDPVVRYAVQVQVEPAVSEPVLGFESQQYQVNWRPDAEEGGDDAAWQPLQELWVSSELAEAIAPSGCQEPAIMLEYFQLAQSTFTSQRFYGLRGSQEYGQAILSGFPVRATIFGPGDTDPIETVITEAESEASPTELFAIPEGLERTSSIGEAF